MDRIHGIHTTLSSLTEGHLQSLSALQTAFYMKPLTNTRNRHTFLKPSLVFSQSHKKLMHDEHCSCKPPLHYMGQWRWRGVVLESPRFLSKFTILHSIKNQNYFHSRINYLQRKHTAAFIEEGVWQAQLSAALSQHLLTLCHYLKTYYQLLYFGCMQRHGQVLITVILLPRS